MYILLLSAHSAITRLSLSLCRILLFASSLMLALCSPIYVIIAPPTFPVLYKSITMTNKCYAMHRNSNIRARAEYKEENVNKGALPPRDR